MSLGVIVLAAGKGTRMKSELPKVLHRAAGRSLLGWVLAAVDPLEADEIVAVIGHGADAVVEALPSGVASVVQEPQLGTGDAVRVGLSGCGDTVDTVLVVPGDMPLLEAGTLATVVETHRDQHAAATVLAVEMDDPTGYGRIERRGDQVIGIVEDRDADDRQRRINEVNTSVYAFDAELLADALGRLGRDNSQGEYYLTDVIGILNTDGHRVVGVVTDVVEGTGVNSHAQLAGVGEALRRRINDRLMAEGVAMLDPSRVYIDAEVAVDPGAVIYPDVYLEGDTTVGAGAVVGPSVHAGNTSIAPGATVRFSVLDGAVIGPEATVGPFSYLRPGTDLKEGAKAGAFVEIKNSQVGVRSKVPHLSYIGDTTIGEASNIGAATVTVNYDGFEKHRTTIGDRVRIGSDTMLVAPVTIGDDAYTGAGSVITHDVTPGALAIERSHQKEIPGYADKRKRRASRDGE
ncbi:MAG: bifunctional UDP-N-acetylglucosamine diphosphorylase/glucosamine-1-phosphate N-acetyltransferase GlmU [Actinomycetota bacterium]|nr:bifunctional UDP-N-acetylglucosamine diphosphorylase/glucosamine-1-phosphate N-acetyltransferase GlmU [Actinomycetota bacterium]